jgi:hypothetical protein
MILLAVTAGACGAAGQRGVCSGIKLGSATAPTARIVGSLQRLSGTYRAMTTRDICAVYGPPRSSRTTGDEQSWQYRAGIGIANFGRRVPEIQFRHTGGTVSFRRGVLVRSSVKTLGHHGPIGG